MNIGHTQSTELTQGRWVAAFGTPRLWAAQAGFLVALSLAAAFERIPLPFTPVPVTLHVLIVFLAALFLGGRRSLPVIAGYLLLGGAGLPVFSGGAAGFAYLFGATGGYLLGFVPAAWMVGTLIRSDSGKRLSRDAAVLAAGLLVVYGFGSMWLKVLTGTSWNQVLILAVYPFVLVDVVKIATAYTAYRLLGDRFRRAVR